MSIKVLNFGANFTVFYKEKRHYIDMMTSKLVLGFYTVFLMIWSSSAQEATTPKYRNYNGPIIHPDNEKHPSKLCEKALDNLGSYWQTIPFDGICEKNIRCSNSPKPDVVLDVKPDTGVVCDTAGQNVCINGKCTYLMPEEVAAAAEENAQPKKIYSNYDGEVIGLRHEKFPTNMCIKEFQDEAASWANDGDACSQNIICYVPSMLGIMSLDKKPENGVIVDWPIGRSLCFNGERKDVEYYVPEDDEMVRAHAR